MAVLAPRLWPISVTLVRFLDSANLATSPAISSYVMLEWWSDSPWFLKSTKNTSRYFDITSLSAKFLHILPYPRRPCKNNMVDLSWFVCVDWDIWPLALSPSYDVIFIPLSSTCSLSSRFTAKALVWSETNGHFYATLTNAGNLNIILVLFKIKY